VNQAPASREALVVIPARFQSSRFPGKPLADLGGKTVIRRCYEQVCLAVDRDRVFVATDDDRIAAECTTHSMSFVMTSDTCLTGTDRVAEVAEQRAAEWYVNVQGDEPFIDPAAVTAMLNAVDAAGPDVFVINAYEELHTEADFRSPTLPKAVTDLNGRLLYVSRASIPTTKKLEYRTAHRQVGMYAFRREALRRFAACTEKTPLEEIEDVEILRFLELGMGVQMIKVESGGIAIDTPDDLARAQEFLRNKR